MTQRPIDDDDDDRNVRITLVEGNIVLNPDRYIGLVRTYRLTATDYIAKHTPTVIGVTHVGTWYEHPLYGDEVGLMVVPTKSDRIHLTYWRDVPTDDDLGITFSPSP